MFSVLSRVGADACKLRRIYVAVVHVVLMYGLETWVTKPHIGRVLVGLHHRVGRRVGLIKSNHPVVVIIYGSGNWYFTMFCAPN